MANPSISEVDVKKVTHPRRRGTSNPRTTADRRAVDRRRREERRKREVLADLKRIVERLWSMFVQGAGGQEDTPWRAATFLLANLTELLGNPPHIGSPAVAIDALQKADMAVWRVVQYFYDLRVGRVPS